MAAVAVMEVAAMVAGVAMVVAAGEATAMTVNAMVAVLMAVAMVAEAIWRRWW